MTFTLFFFLIKENFYFINQKMLLPLDLLTFYDRPCHYDRIMLKYAI